MTGSTIGLSIDAQDRVWTIHRPNTVEDNFKAADIAVGDERGRDDEALPGAARGGATPQGFIGRCCKVAPPVLVYDQAGNLVKSWGGPGQGYDWPDSNHGITIDHEGNVWLAGNGEDPARARKHARLGGMLRARRMLDAAVVEYEKALAIGGPEPFVAAADTKNVVIPVGRRSMFGHPHREVVERWQHSGAEVIRTGAKGTVTITTDGSKIRIDTFLH